MSSSTPTAVYTSPIEAEPVTLTPGEGPHSTDGKTTQISDIVIKAGGQDKDKPTPAKDTPLGQLRAELTTLQDKLNEFLTHKMSNKRKLEEENDDIERRILDDGVDEDSD